ncbi:MAG: HEAT repeat domain-containing protein [Rhodanobacteraceae bacterium]
MKRAFLAAIVLGASCSASLAAAPPLKSDVQRADGWVGYHVPMIAGAGEPCCFSWRGSSKTNSGCDLDGRNWSFGTHDGQKPTAQNGTLAMYVHVDHGGIDRVRAVAASCPVKANNAIRWIDDADATQSVQLLAVYLGNDQRNDSDDALAALAYHADATATAALAARAEPTHPRDARKQALFWLGQARGVDGAAIVERYATTDSDPELRAEAIFALSQSTAGDGYARIHAIALNDPSDHVRSQALFWMAQMEDDRAAHDITAAIATEKSEDVREQAVFALSQLEDDQADEALIALMRGHYSRDVKKQALFWLGESGSPRAMQFFDEALSKSP